MAIAHTQDLVGTLKFLELGFLGRVPPKLKPQCEWIDAAQGLFRIQITGSGTFGSKIGQEMPVPIPR